MPFWKKHRIPVASLEGEIAEARQQRASSERMIADLERSVQQNAGAQQRVRARGRQNGYGRELELVVHPREA